MRWPVIAAGIALAMPSIAVAQANTERGDRNAYNYAIRCFAVDAFARDRGQRTDRGERAFSVAYRLGARLGLTPQQMRADINARVATEMTTMRRDEAYLNQAMSDCTRLGFL